MGDHDGHSGCGGGGVPDVDCFELVRQLYVYLDGELTEERREEIAVHLDECGPCADAAGFEAELRAVISSRCKDRVPDSLIDRVAATIAAEEARQSSGAGGTGGAGGAGGTGGAGGAGEAAGGGGGAGGSGTPGAGPGSAPA